LLLRNFGPYGIIFINVCVVITIAMVMLLKDFGVYGIILGLLSQNRPWGLDCEDDDGIIFMAMCVYYFRFSCHS
jgi:hypothetical protein